MLRAVGVRRAARLRHRPPIIDRRSRRIATRSRAVRRRGCSRNTTRFSAAGSAEKTFRVLAEPACSSRSPEMQNAPRREALWRSLAARRRLPAAVRRDARNADQCRAARQPARAARPIASDADAPVVPSENGRPQAAGAGARRLLPLARRDVERCGRFSAFSAGCATQLSPRARAAGARRTAASSATRSPGWKSTATRPMLSSTGYASLRGETPSEPMPRPARAPHDGRPTARREDEDDGDGAGEDSGCRFQTDCGPTTTRSPLSRSSFSNSRMNSTSASTPSSGNAL